MTGIELIAAERQRQIEAEGYTPEHDDAHKWGEIACAAAVYTTPPTQRTDYEIASQLWPLEWQQKDCDRVRELVIAGALIATEIDRLQRLENTESNE